MEYEYLDEEVVYHGRVFDLARVRYRLPDDSEHTYDLVKHHGAVTILPIDEQGRIWFVHQYRIGAGQVLLELPAGLLEEGESAEACALREVQEEVGKAASDLRLLGEFYMVPGYSSEKLVAFLATGLYDSPMQGDRDEFLRVEAIPAWEVYQRVARGEIRDGKTIAVLLMAQPYLANFR